MINLCSKFSGFWVSALLLLSACHSVEPRRDLASPQIDSTISALRAYLLDPVRRHDGTYWAAPFTSDITSDALMLALGQRIDKMTPALAESYAQSMSDRMTGDRTGWPAYAGGPTDFNITAIALLCLQSAHFLSSDFVTHVDPRFQTALAWFQDQGGMKKVNNGSDQLYVRLMLGPLDLVDAFYDPMLTPNTFGMPSTFPIHFNRDGFLRGLVAPSIGIRYLESLQEPGALKEYAQTPEAWRKMVPDMGRYHAHHPHHIGDKKCVVPENNVDGFFEDVAANPGKYSRCIFYPEHGGEKLKTKIAHFFHEPMTNRVLDALNFVIRRSVTGTQLYWAEQALALELQLLNPGGAWYTVGFTMCGVRMLQEAQRVGLGSFQEEIDRAWDAVQRMRVVNQDGHLIQQWVLTGTWDTASTLLAFEPLRGTRFALSAADAAASTKWLLDRSIRSDGTRGWSFDETDATLPDVDDTAVVLSALSVYQDDSDPEKREMIKEAMAFLTSRQNKDGGYPAWSTSMSKFLVDIVAPSGQRREMFSVLADFSQPDVTGRVMFAFDQANLTGQAPSVARFQKSACDYVANRMDKMKSPHLKLSAGNWMVNYVYSASSVLNGLVSAGCAPQKQAALAQFVVSAQQGDPHVPSVGGWGEAPTGYASSSYVAGTPTIMQTSVAVVGLTAYYESLQRAGAPVSPELIAAIEKGVAFLVARTQGGTAPVDEEFNGVLIRGVTYARYELAPAYLALYALGRYRRAVQ